MRYAFVNQDGAVVNVISGALTEQQQQRFLADYGVLFGATEVIAVDETTVVWMGGSYTDGVFAPPPEPEPLPETLLVVPVEPLPEVITEPEI